MLSKLIPSRRAMESVSTRQSFTRSHFMDEEEIQGIPAPPDTKSWFEYSWKLQQEIPNRFEDAAKFLATMISLTIAIISTALDKLTELVVQPILVFIVLILWLVALFFAFLVLFPKKYKFHSKSIETIKQANDKIIKTKHKRFVISTVLYFIPLLILTISYLFSMLESL